MLVLGLCVAHDAGVALIDNGHVVGLVQRERWDRRKRSALITPDFLEHALKQLGANWSDIDVVAIATCQAWPYIFPEPDRFRFAYSLEAGRELGLDDDQIRRFQSAERSFEKHRESSMQRASEIAGGLYSEYIAIAAGRLGDPDHSHPNVEWPVSARLWTDRVVERHSISQAIMRNAAVAPSSVGYAPARVYFEGIPKPGVLVPHHLSHAAYGFYNSGEDRAAIATLDNGDVINQTCGYAGGILAIGEGNGLRVLDFRFAYEGHLYQRIGEFCGLGHGGAAGKLMGLAPYGEPAYYHPQMLGDANQVYGSQYIAGDKDGRGHVMAPMIGMAKQAYAQEGRRLDRLVPGIDPGGFGATDVTIQKSRLAASAQALLEEQTLLTVGGFHDGLRHAGIDVGAIVLSGGTALNCPANSRVARETPFERVRVAPAVDDSGLPIGAAQAVAHDLFGIRRPDVDPDSAELAYLGSGYDDRAVEQAIQAANGAVKVVDSGNPSRSAATDLTQDKIVAWFEGRSEIGPRALGHRSILADARKADNWRRVNALKKREAWRPFAPAVLAEKAGDWFDGPLPSAHMLFTATVKGSALPAITHVDGSARLQTVGKECGGVRQVLENFDALTGVPVVMNTSFNGPGEPIVETPEQAIAFLVSSEIDTVYLEGRKLVRAGEED